MIKKASALFLSFFIGVLVTYFIFKNKNVYHNVENAPKERQVLFWYDPMYPNTKFDKPGPSPFMDMDLVPKYADENDSPLASSGVRIDPIQVQNLGVRTQKAIKDKLLYTYKVPANLTYNDYEYAIVQPRADGFVEKTYPITVGNNVLKNQPLIDITIPEWSAAQSEYLLLSENYSDKEIVGGALERLRLMGMPEQTIDLLKKTKKIQTLFTLKAPIDGVITEFNVRMGMNVSKNDIIAKIQGINPIWINAEVPESFIHSLDSKKFLSISVPSYPDKNFSSNKWEVLPGADVNTRTVTVRIEVENPDYLLRPGMQALVTINSESEPMVIIPSQAIIDIGNEQRVITVDENGRFIPKIIKIYKQSKSKAAIYSGLSEGETVVITGQFLIDSEADIAGVLDAMRANLNDSH